MKKEVITIRKETVGYKNLVPTFNKWNLSERSSINSDGEELILYAVTPSHINRVYIPITPEKTYTISIRSQQANSYFYAYAKESIEGNVIGVNGTPSDPAFSSYNLLGDLTFTFTAPIGSTVLELNATNVNGNETLFFKVPCLVEGTTGKDYVPYNYSNPIKERIKYSGFIEEVRIRFYAGVEKALQVRPYVIRDGRRMEDLFTYPEGTDPYITGDDDYLVFPVNMEINTDDELIVEYTNLEKDFIYTLSIDFVLIYNMEVL